MLITAVMRYSLHETTINMYGSIWPLHINCIPVIYVQTFVAVVEVANNAKPSLTRQSSSNTGSDWVIEVKHQIIMMNNNIILCTIPREWFELI